MQNRKTVLRAAAVLLTLIVFPLIAQGQANSYSPYSLYGMGDLSSQGPANLRSMGGTGVGFRRTEPSSYAVSLNYLNPASYSGMPRKALLFNVGLEGQSFFLEQGDRESSYSTFNVRDIGVMFPLAKGVGFAVTVTPFSSVGYRMQQLFNDYQGQIGSYTKYYEGDGDITQIKAGLGVQISPRLSIGAEMVYLKGMLDRSQEIVFNNELVQQGFTNTYSEITEDISRFTMLVGAQYNVISSLTKSLTLGATYRMGVKLDPKTEHYIPSTSNDPNPAYDNWSTGKLELADEISLGFYYHTLKWSVGADYVFANWGDRNKNISVSAGDIRMKYTDTHGFKAGVQFTPQFSDIRSFLRRVSYRFGVKYQQGYMEFAGKKIDEKAVMFGLGIPLKYGYMSGLDFGFEYGQTGTTGKGLIKTDYIKFSVGFRLFSDRDYWFMKKKYD